MDPNANLREQRRLAAWLLEKLDTSDELGPTNLQLALTKAERLAELVLALDTWRAQGGALPSDWAGGA